MPLVIDIGETYLKKVAYQSILLKYFFTPCTQLDGQN